ncbi:MAG: orotidine-5'-phosphate decarboxylase [Candidatus Omnitrophota bacterium]
MPSLENKLIVALDVDSLKKARHFVDILYPKVKIFKVGSQLFSSCGPEAVKMILKKGAQVFLDLKFYDIPNTVANAVCQAARLKVKMLTLHVQGGRPMLLAAVKSAKEEATRLKIKQPWLIGVTVLTSRQAQTSQVIKLARIAKDCGLNGAVCSVLEAPLIKKTCGRKFLVVTPGIRPGGGNRSDQRRVATPQQALAAGADFIVVGRPIILAKDPLQETKRILGQLG